MRFEYMMSKDNHKNSRDDKSGKGEKRGGRRTAEKPFSKLGKKDSQNFAPRNFKENGPSPRFKDNKDSKNKEFNKFDSKPSKFDRGTRSKEGYKGKEGYKRDEQGKFSDNRPFRKREISKYNHNTANEDKGERVAPVLRPRKKTSVEQDTIRLNRYISNSGICSRRKADELIEAGVISVNGKVVSELGFKVDPFKDEVRYNGELLKREKKIYVLLNKPKDYITTTDDPQERRTVMQLVENASRERIYPVGRLDRNTTGLLLMTNDGELADKLSHPRNGITKIYHVELNKNLTQGDFNKIQFGLDLEDGFIKPDNISFVSGGSKREIGIQIHSGKNRIVRRIFEHLGYDVVKLDRVVYGNLTKKDLPRGRWRYLDEHELIQIKHLIK